MASTGTVHELPVVKRDEICSFLTGTLQDNIHLVAIDPDDRERVPGKWFGEQIDAAIQWAVMQNAQGLNVYWTVNLVRPGLDKKPKKADIVGARFLHADIDPPFNRDDVIGKLKAEEDAASFAIDSGNGLQGFWRLEYVAANQAAIEDLNQRIADRFGADNCWNIDRLMRLPGTVNFPNAKKRALGRIQTVASVFIEDTGEVYDPERFRTSLPPAIPRVGKERSRIHLIDVTILAPQDLSIAKSNRLHGLICMPKNTDRSAATYAAVCEMVRQGFSSAQIAGIILNPELAISAHCRDQFDAMRSITRVIGAARADVRLTSEGQGDREIEANDDRRPTIQIRAGALHIMATEAESALIDAKTPFYVRAGIVRPIVEEVDASDDRTTKVARLALVDEPTISDYLSAAANWAKFDIRKNADKPADPPERVARILLSREGRWRFPRLTGVITTPTLRPDGTILSVAGYDPATRLLLIDPPELPPIPETPSREDALAALAVLDELLDEFPFVDSASRSAALSCLLVPVLRGALKVCPLHVTTAPVAGSGKSYIIDISSVIGTGEIAPVISAGKTEEELDKRLGAALLGGQAILSIDNVNGELGGDFLCQIIERPSVGIRPLGVSRLVKIDSRTSCFATGNNIQIVGDMTRRVIICSLDPNVERPELRSFRASPLEMVHADRPKYIAAALTIARAYVVAGYPGVLKPLASFGDWSRLVRSPLVWLGCTDPIETMNKARAEDPVIGSLSALLHALYSAGDGSSRTSSGIKELAALLNPLGNPINADLHEALVNVAGDRGVVDSRRLGRYLGQHHGRIVDGLKLVAGEDKHVKQRIWRVERV